MTLTFLLPWVLEASTPRPRLTHKFGFFFHKVNGLRVEGREGWRGPGGGEVWGRREQPPSPQRGHVSIFHQLQAGAGEL